MTARTRKLAATAATAAALVAVMGGAQPAAAAGHPEAAFYTGAGQSGTEILVDLADTGTCQNLSQPVLSGANLSAQDIDVYFNADCRTGAPGTTSDLFYRLGSLHLGNFGFPAVSYRVHP
ncbi:hypothetical protein AB0O64_04240 [Streptomyces sp. NPDC088341]|uniref:hypothetical protein n=1 Tax=Streptomyces sp. NPDC088341 TaxID=3154870 RepID=UPI003413D719